MHGNFQVMKQHASRKGTGTSRAATQVVGPRLAVVGGNVWGRQVARKKARPVACRWGEEDTAGRVVGPATQLQFLQQCTGLGEQSIAGAHQRVIHQAPG